MRPAGRHARHRVRRSTTVPLAAVALAAGLLYVQFAPGLRTVIAKSDVPSLTLVARRTDRPTSPDASDRLRSELGAVTCHHLVYLGDSNLGMAAGRFHKAFDAIGIDAVINTGNGRGATIVKQGTNALDAIAAFRETVPAAGRCWIIELSAADAMQAAKQHTDAIVPIRKIADALDGEPALWITPVLTSTTSDWTLEASTAYNQALLDEVAARPSITVLDWQDIALQHLDQWQPDGVHYKDPLYDLFTATVMAKINEIWTLAP